MTVMMLGISAGQDMTFFIIPFVFFFLSLDLCYIRVVIVTVNIFYVRQNDYIYYSLLIVLILMMCNSS